MENVTSDLLKPFFTGDNQYNSLIDLKKLLDQIPKKDQKILKKKLTKLLSFIKVDSFLPINIEDENEDIIEILNPILNLRGLINKNRVNNREAIILLSSENKNIDDHEFNVDTCKVLINEGKMSEIQYSQYIQKDVHSNFFCTCDVKNFFPLPIFIYAHFINTSGFTFASYSDSGKIDYYHNLFWLTKFFLYGLTNECKIKGKSEYFINNLVYFIEEGMKTNDPYFNVLIQGSKELSLFLYDYVYTKFCSSKEQREYIVKFQFVDFVERDPIFRDLCRKYPSICERLRCANPYPYDLNILHLKDDEISEISLSDFVFDFEEIPEIEKEIQIYDEWKQENIKMLAYENIFQLVRSNLFQRKSDVKNFDDKFGQWFLNSNVSLINREVYSLFKALNKGRKEDIQNQILILKRIINPWNNDDRFYKYFMNHLLNSRLSFSSLVTFNEKVADSFSLLINMVKNCKPFYVTVKNDKTTNNIEKTFLFYEKFEVNTFYIERLLYCISMYPQSALLKPIYKNIFDFFSFLPFVHKTIDLPYLSAFANEIVNLFRDQLNLSFIFLSSTTNCIDLIDNERFPLIEKVVNKFIEWNCLDELKEALKSADLYNKGENASEKLKSYTNKLIEINNNTILYHKHQPEKIHFRLLTKTNTHSNISLMNTFIPALSHINANTDDRQKLVCAYYLLTKSTSKIKEKNKKFTIDKQNTFNSSLPNVFNFKSNSFNNFANSFMVIILPIPENCDFLGFDKNKLILSLRVELNDHIENNKNSYRTLIWNKLQNEKNNTENSNFFDDDDDDDPLNILLALFEVFDIDDIENHRFFNTDDWPNNTTPPEDIESARSAFNFLQKMKND